MMTPPLQEPAYGQVLVEWGQERLLLDLPPPTARLLDLKNLLALRTGVRPDQQTLIHSGFKLKDDMATLDRYHLYDPPSSEPVTSRFSNLLRGFNWAPARSNAPKRLLLIGSPETQATVSDLATPASHAGRPAPSKAFKGPVQDEKSALERIQHVLAGKDDLLAKIQNLEDNAATVPANEAQQTNVVLSETLLQMLLKLDSVDVQSEWTEARQARKQGVKSVQDGLDRLDGIKSNLAQRESVASQATS